MLGSEEKEVEARVMRAKQIRALVRCDIVGIMVEKAVENPDDPQDKQVLEGPARQRVPPKKLGKRIR